MTSLITLDDVSPPAVPASPLARTRELVLAGSALIGVFVIGFGTWSVVAPLESAAVATGTVVSESSRKTVQHLEGGIISAILVHDGDTVTAGQTLIRLDDTKARTTLLAVRGQLWDAKAREARLIAERDSAAEVSFPADLVAQRSEPAVAAAIAGQQKIFDARHSLEQSKIAAIKERINQVHEEITGHQAEVSALEKRVALLQEEINGVKELVAKGLERKPRLLQLQRDLADADGKRGDTLAQIARAKQTIAEAEIDILSLQNDRQKDVADELRETQKKGHELAEQAQAAADVLTRVDVKAPENGTITDLRVHTLGGVINPGEALLDLVPQSDRLVVEVQVRPDDIDRVHEGLTAQVRLLPYKQRRTPPLDATVIYVSADRLTDKRTDRPYYTAKLRIDEKELASLGDEVKMVPG
ncbi:MAG TPA: HlyD family type I secretion periplasmic adaptor subunit, partial [Stellaceae bacterium]|nr:HlyD family type I secretion periplasmic adaptor subunit [Stellaceae bacterium]